MKFKTFVKSEIKEAFEPFKITGSDYKKIIIIFFFSSFFLLPILLHDIYYQDDVYRALTGNYDWYGLGRPLAAEIARFASASGMVLLDTSPLTQILAMLMVGYSLLVSHKFLSRESNFPILFLFPAFFTPYLFSNLLFKFDSLGMMGAILFATVSFVIDSNSNKVKFTLASFFIVASLSCYQPLTNIFIGLLGLQIITTRESNHFKLIVNRLSVFFVGYILYYLTIGLVVSPRTDRSSLISPNIDGVERMLENALRFVNMTFEIYKTIPFAVGLSLSLIIGLILVFLKREKFKLADSKRLFLSIFLFFISLFGPLILLQNPLISYRTVATSTFLICIIFLFFYRKNENMKFLIIIPLMLTMSFGYTMMNAFKNQQEFENRIIDSIFNDISKLNDASKTVYAVGDFPLAPNARLACEQNPVIAKYVYRSYDWILDAKLISAGLTEMTFMWNVEKEEKVRMIRENFCSSNNEIEVQSKWYQIYFVGEINSWLILVNMNKNNFCAKYL